MNRLPEDFFNDPPPEEPTKRGKYLNSPKSEGIKLAEIFVWSEKLSRLKSDAIRNFLEENYPDKVFTPEEVARNGHRAYPDDNLQAEEELFIWQGRAVLHFKWSNRRKTFTSTEI